jgi:hypothetical protein
MRGDFSRIRFNGAKNYTAVLEQQGRVALDADANEQCFIDAYRTQAETIDAVGQFGGPAGDAGFQISVPGSNEILVGPGRYYVNGLLCENPAGLSYDDQPCLIVPATAVTAAGLLAELTAGAGSSAIQFWLEVWQRVQTALDDPCLREPALGQADTTARLQTVWRVVAALVPTSLPPPQPVLRPPVLLPPVEGRTLSFSTESAAPRPLVTQTGAGPDCCQEMYGATTLQASTGTLTASTSGPAADCGCGPVAAAGYQGIENQLYRVEIHTGGNQAQATFKWSRENGSVVTAITKVSGSVVTVSSLGPDANLGFQAGQWVELTDDTLEFGPVPNLPGTLYQIQSVQPTDLSVTLAGPAGQTIPVDPGQNARMRRWDQSGPAATAIGVPLAAGSAIQLENGIEVSFGSGTFASGDYWTIPARTATGQIQWPPCGSDGNVAQLPTSVTVYRAPLACLHWTPPATSASAPGVQVEDCRMLFSPLTAIAPPSTVEALHVTAVSWVNDDVVTLDALVTSGLTITLDQAPTSPLGSANVVVTVELANQAAVDNFNLPLNSGNPRDPLKAPATNLRTVTVIDTPVTLTGTVVSWQLPDTGGEVQSILIQNLSSYLYQGAPAQQWAKVRIRLLGPMIYAVGAAGTAYLDGRVLGQPGTRQDGSTPRIDLKLPSGAGGTASDFDGWLYVAPILQTTAVLITPGAVSVTVNFLNQVTGVVVTGSSPASAATPTAEVVLNYPPLVETTVTIGLSNTDGSSNGVGNIVSVPSTVTVPVGQTTVSFPISVIANPGASTLNFNISVTVGVRLGGENLANGTFSVTGVVPPPPVITRPVINPIT